MTLPESAAVAAWVAAGVAAVLAAITLWYAHSTKKIAKGTETLGQETANLARQTERMAQAAHDALFQETTPLLGCLLGPTNISKGTRLDLSVTWTNHGRGQAIGLGFAYRLYGETKVVAHPHTELAPGGTTKVSYVVDPSLLRPTTSEADLTFIAKYRDMFGNTFQSVKPYGHALQFERSGVGPVESGSA